MDTTDPDLDPVTGMDPGLLDAVRAASGAPPAEGSAARVAAGAWERTGHLPGRRGLRLLPGGARPLCLAAAAAVLLAAGLILVPVSEPAFAVEKGRVRVLRGDAWEDSRDVRAGQTVWAGAGTHLTGPDAAHIRSDRGGVFLLESTEATSFVVQVLGGVTEVEGASISLRAGDVRVERDEHVPSFGVRVEFDTASGSPPTTAAPAAPPFGSTPTVHVFRGRVQLTTSTESIHLSSPETARVVTTDEDGGTGLRLAMVARWTDDLPERLLEGGRVPIRVTFKTGGALNVLCSGEDGHHLVDLDIPADLVERAVPRLNVYTQLMGARIASLEDRDAQVARVLAVREEAARLRDATTLVGDFRHLRDGVETRIRILENGRALLETGAGKQAFDSLVELRKAAPEAAALFGDRLR